MVERIVVACCCIHAFGTDTFHQTGIFGWQADLASLQSEFVDFLVQGIFLYRIGLGSPLVILGDDFLVDRLFFRPVEGTDIVCSLEHDVLQVMGKSGVFFRLVDGAGAYTNQSEHVRLGCVFPYIYGKTIFQFECFQSLTKGWHGYDGNGQT